MQASGMPHAGIDDNKVLKLHGGPARLRVLRMRRKLECE
jgi:hypothetical protein